MAEATPLFLRPTVQQGSLLLVMLTLFLTGVCLGQGAQDRYQLGRRLERFERAWEQAPRELRAKSTSSMEKAVESFFSLQLGRAGKMLDQAWLQVRGDQGVDLSERLESLRWKLDFEVTLLDTAKPVLRGRAGGFYDQPSEVNARTELVLKVWPWDDSPAKLMQADAQADAGDSEKGRAPRMIKTLVIAPEESFEVDLMGLEAGDYVITGHPAGSPPGEYDWICPSVSLVDRLEDRMSALESWAESNRKVARGLTKDASEESASDTPANTARFLAREILRGKKGGSFEIDLPWNKLLRDFEQVAQVSLGETPTEDQVQASFDRWIRKPGWKWMQLGLGRSTQVIRMEVPEYDQSDSARKLPVLIALHGAGGSENMFFQTYGAGRLVELGKNRQWIVVSPRQTMMGLSLDVPQMIEALAKHLPVDTQQVFLVGHSMGAAQAMSQVSKYPDSLRMVAALGGGGGVRDTEAIRKIPFFVAAGERDFGKPRAKALSEQLRRIGCSVKYQEYTEVEHMVIVQAALDDVFAFFDQGIQ